MELTATPQNKGMTLQPIPGVISTDIPERGDRRWSVSEKTVAQKARVKAGATIAVINRVPDVVESLGLPRGAAFVRPAKADLVFLFVRTRAELKTRMPSAVASLGPASALWVFFRKGSGSAGLDMNRDTVWEAAEKLHLRPLGLVSVDDTWSAFRLKRTGPAGGDSAPLGRRGVVGGPPER